MFAQMQEFQNICQRELKLDSRQRPSQHKELFIKRARGPHPLADRRNFVKKKIAFVSQ